MHERHQKRTNDFTGRAQKYFAEGAAETVIIKIVERRFAM